MQSSPISIKVSKGPSKPYLYWGNSTKAVFCLSSVPAVKTYYKMNNKWILLSNVFLLARLHFKRSFLFMSTSIPCCWFMCKVNLSSGCSMLGMHSYRLSWCFRSWYPSRMWGLNLWLYKPDLRSQCFFLKGHILVWLSCIYSSCLKIKDFLPEIGPLYLIRNALCCFRSYEKLDCRTLQKTIPWTSDVAQVEHGSLTLGSSISKKKGEWGRGESEISEG